MKRIFSTLALSCFIFFGQAQGFEEFKALFQKASLPYEFPKASIGWGDEEEETESAYKPISNELYAEIVGEAVYGNSVYHAVDQIPYNDYHIFVVQATEMNINSGQVMTSYELWTFSKEGKFLSYRKVCTSGMGNRYDDDLEVFYTYNESAILAKPEFDESSKELTVTITNKSSERVTSSEFGERKETIRTYYLKILENGEVQDPTISIPEY